MADLALIMSADKYEIPDEKTGVIQALHQMWYCNDYRDDSETELGCKPIKMLTTPEIFAQLKQHKLPALFHLELRSRPGKGNTAALTVVGIKHVSTPKLFDVDEPVKAAKVPA